MVLRAPLTAASIIVTLVACSAGSSSSSSGADGGPPLSLEPDASAEASPSGSDAAAPGTGTSANGVLSIVSLTSTVATITGGTPTGAESAAVTFVAIVTDTLGLETIAGGQLLDTDGRTYGAFGAGANKGTYTASVTWGLVNQVSAVSYQGAKASRKFVARFFDNAGNKSDAEVTLSFACRDPFYDIIGACAGNCVDTKSTATDCGACGQACAAGLVCKGGACTPPLVNADNFTECIDRRMLAGAHANCKQVCLAAGRADCVNGLRYSEAPACAMPTHIASWDSYRCGSSDFKPYQISFKCQCSALQ